MQSFKAFLFFILMAVVPCSLAAKIINYNAPTLSQIQSVSPEDTIFLFDLHRVIFKTKKSDRFNKLWQLPNKGLAAKLLLNPWFMKDVYKFYRNNQHCFEAYVEHLIKKYPKMKEFKQHLLGISNTQKINQPVVDLLIELKNRGFRLFIFSNIGEQTFEQLREMFPEVFELFEDKRICTPNDNYRSKPHQDAYIGALNMLEKYDITTAKYKIIFVDDKKRNVKEAAIYRMYALLYRTPEQFEYDLKQIQAI